ncbi:TetR/AcrR family transcriptional regulator [Lactiplantibacillus paraplantarum]|uniref:TetR/AcrR family transcriptional regulator n=1 Tax=Lactiplantibacillus paraplantarum TaxID=60520 RepID=UPI0021A7CB7F|nr:helix-turn-helix domain-containing protein [Lactiplantibacillus paraplantarum]MCT4457713.1 TetR/AcrR family transcriptional regulator [Lactiplantibacillus paraplantarum]
MTIIENKQQAILASATRLFIEPGYSETRMQMIAAEANIAVGTLYKFFKSKPDLLNFVFTATISGTETFTNQSELFKPTSKAELLNRTTTLYQNEQKKLTTILVKTHTAGSFTQLLTYLFTTFDRYGAYFLILERNQDLYPTLLDLYKKYRQALYENTTRYLTTMSDNGLISALIQPKYDAAMIIDEIFWWSAHQEYDSFERGEHIFNKQLMRNAVISKLKRSYQEQLW